MMVKIHVIIWAFVLCVFRIMAQDYILLNAGVLDLLNTIFFLFISSTVSLSILCRDVTSTNIKIAGLNMYKRCLQLFDRAIISNMSKKEAADLPRPFTNIIITIFINND